MHKAEREYNKDCVHVLTMVGTEKLDYMQFGWTVNQRVYTAFDDIVCF